MKAALIVLLISLLVASENSLAQAVDNIAIGYFDFVETSGNSDNSQSLIPLPEIHYDADEFAYSLGASLKSVPDLRVLQIEDESRDVDIVIYGKIYRLDDSNQFRIEMMFGDKATYRDGKESLSMVAIEAKVGDVNAAQSSLVDSARAMIVASFKPAGHAIDESFFVMR